MRRLLKKMAVILLVGCICLGGTAEVRAEKAKLEEWSNIMEYTVYDCGTKTDDGVLEIQSETSSLKEGDSVDVRVLYYGGAQNAEGPLHGASLDLFYDETVLEFQDAVVEDNVILEYGASVHIEDASASIEKGGWQRLKVDFNKKKVEQDICLFKIRFRVLQTVQSTTIGVEPFSILIYDGVTASSNRYGNTYTLQEGEEEWQDRMTCTITDASAASSIFTLSSIPAQGSEDVTVLINIEKNDGFNHLGLTLDYDTSLFTYDSLEIDDSLKSKISLDSVYESPGSGRIKVSFIALEDITDVGDFLKLKLKVKDNVTAGTKSNVGVEITQVGNKAETAMKGIGTTCAINITSGNAGEEEQQPILGDVNADNKIDLVDAVYILQNYNQVREFTKAQEIAADVTKDGNVNLVDALMIMKYFNEEVTEF